MRKQEGFWGNELAKGLNSNVRGLRRKDRNRQLIKATLIDRGTGCVLATPFVLVSLWISYRNALTPDDFFPVEIE